MNEKIFKYLAIFFFIIVVWSFCTDSSEEYYDVNVQTLVPANEGLDLKAVGSLLKKADTGEEFEQLLNSPAEGVNNLDLDQDGTVDYISVTEYGNDKIKGFSLATQPASGEVQEIATIEVEKAADQANVEVKGNEQIYGSNHYYRSSFGLGELLILSWMFNNRPYYRSPWGYGSYPSWYGRYSTVPSSTYQRNMGRYTSSSSYRGASSSSLSSNVKSPNAGKTATSVRAPLKNPTASQKSFQTRANKNVRSGGFGRSGRSSSSLRSSSSRRSGGFRSGK